MLREYLYLNLDTGPLFLAPVEIIDSNCSHTLTNTKYEVDVKFEKDLEYFGLEAIFETSEGIIIDQVTVSKEELEEGNTYRYIFVTDLNTDIKVCRLNNDEVIYPTQTMTATCTGDCVFTADSGNNVPGSEVIPLAIVLVILIGISIGVIKLKRVFFPLKNNSINDNRENNTFINSNDF